MGGRETLLVSQCTSSRSSVLQVQKNKRKQAAEMCTFGSVKATLRSDAASSPGLARSKRILCAVIASCVAADLLRGHIANRCCVGLHVAGTPKSGFARCPGTHGVLLARHDAVRRPVRRMPVSGAQQQEKCADLREVRRRLPPVPSPIVALDPELQVGSAVTATG